MTRLVIVGCGGFGREVLELVWDINDAGGGIDVLGFVDDAPSQENADLVARMGQRILGSTRWFEVADHDVLYVLGIGNAHVNSTLDEQLTALGVQPGTLIHPQASIGRFVELGAGTIICAGARVSTNIATGRHVHIDRNCLVGHDSTLGDHAILYPGAAVAGSVEVSPEVTLGSMASILPGLYVGTRTTVGAGAVVTRSVPPEKVAMGVPARWSDDGHAGNGPHPPQGT